MKKITFIIGMLLAPFWLLAQDDSCTCGGGDQWSAFAYMINEYHEKLPPKQQEITTGFQFNTSWKEEAYFDESVFVEDIDPPISNDTWTFDLSQNDPVDIIINRADLLTPPPPSIRPEIEEEEVIERPIFEEPLIFEEEEDLEIPNILEEEPIESVTVLIEKTVEVEVSEEDFPEEEDNDDGKEEVEQEIQKKVEAPTTAIQQRSRTTNSRSTRDIPRFEEEEDDGESKVAGSKSYSSSRVKSKRKIKYIRLKRPKKVRKYKGQCPFK